MHRHETKIEKEVGIFMQQTWPLNQDRTMDKVQKLNNSECYTPLSEPIRIELRTVYPSGQLIPNGWRNFWIGASKLALSMKTREVVGLWVQVITKLLFILLSLVTYM
jgi:hypothetical protein